MVGQGPEESGQGLKGRTDWENIEETLGMQRSGWDGHVHAAYAIDPAGTQQPKCKAGRWRGGWIHG